MIHISYVVVFSAEKVHEHSRVSLFLGRLINTFDLVGNYANRTLGTQGSYQAAGTCVAIAFGLVGGVCVGEFNNAITL